jgi:hypothetical protein
MIAVVFVEVPSDGALLVRFLRPDLSASRKWVVMTGVAALLLDTFAVAVREGVLGSNSGAIVVVVDGAAAAAAVVAAADIVVAYALAAVVVAGTSASVHWKDPSADEQRIEEHSHIVYVVVAAVLADVDDPVGRDSKMSAVRASQPLIPVLNSAAKLTDVVGIDSVDLAVVMLMEIGRAVSAGIALDWEMLG